MMTKIVIGLLTYNEERHIDPFFDDLRAQTIFDDGLVSHEIGIYLVANGCTDFTVATAQGAFNRLSFPKFVTFHPVELSIASKTNAWNIFMHEIMPAETDYLCMLDADIRIPKSDLIGSSIAALEANPKAVVASDVSVKSFAAVSRLNPMRLLNHIFQRPAGTDVAICGQFYCARAREMRRIVLPIGLLSQDGYLRAMTLTEGFTHPEQLDRIHVVPGAFHLHPAYTSFTRMFRFQKRQAIGTSISRLVYDEIVKMPAGFDLRMGEIAKRNRANPDWVSLLIDTHLLTARNFVPNSYIFRMLHSARRARGAGRLKWVIVPFAIVYDSWVALFANAEIRNRGVGSINANKGKFTIRQ